MQGNALLFVQRLSSSIEIPACEKKRWPVPVVGEQRGDAAGRECRKESGERLDPAGRGSGRGRMRGDSAGSGAGHSGDTKGSSRVGASPARLSPEQGLLLGRRRLPAAAAAAAERSQPGPQPHRSRRRAGQGRAGPAPRPTPAPAPVGPARAPLRPRCPVLPGPSRSCSATPGTAPPELLPPSASSLNLAHHPPAPFCILPIPPVPSCPLQHLSLPSCILTHPCTPCRGLLHPPQCHTAFVALVPPLEQTSTGHHSTARTQKSLFSSPLCHYTSRPVPTWLLGHRVVILGAAMGNGQGGWAQLSPGAGGLLRKKRRA